jgi:hypothetical protein
MLATVSYARLQRQNCVVGEDVEKLKQRLSLLDYLALPWPGGVRSAYVLVAIVKKRLQLSASLYEILQILSLTMFEKIPLDQLLTQTISEQIQPVSDNQLILFA